MKKTFLLLAAFAAFTAIVPRVTFAAPLPDGGPDMLGSFSPNYFFFAAALGSCPTPGGCPYAIDNAGNWASLHVDSSGNLMLASPGAGASAGSSCPSFGGCPWVLDPSGNWVHLNVDASGNLLTTVTGGAGVGDFSGPASSTSGDLVSFSGTGGKTGQDSAIAAANVVTAAANYTSGNLVKAAASNKTTSDSGVAAANVVTAASNYTNNALAKAAGANKTTSSSLAIDDGTTLTYTGTGGGSFTAVTTTGTATADSCTELAFSTQANAGFISFWCDSTNHRLNDINSSGTIGTTVVAKAAVSHQFLTSLTAAGGVLASAQPDVSDLSGFGTNVATWLGTPSSANFFAAITDETGSGAVVGATSPTITTPTLTGAITKTGQNEAVASSGAINTVETILVQSPAALAANRLIAKTRILVTLVGTCTSTVANTSLFKIHIGTAGTTSDTTAFSVTTPAAATSGTNVPFRVILDMVVRVPGASATSYGEYSITNQGVTGLSTSQANTNLATMAAFDTTAADFITVTYQAAASTTTSTFQIASIEFPNN